jgi:hypothetical protein
MSVMVDGFLAARFGGKKGGAQRAVERLASGE